MKNYNSGVNVKMRNSDKTEYYEIQKILYDKKNRPCDFVIGKLIGVQGAYGKVHEVSCNGNSSNATSKYILKKLRLGDIDDLEKETNIQNLAASHNLAPKVILSYAMDDECGFVMERLKITVGHFLSKTIEDPKVFEGLDLEELGDNLDVILDNYSSFNKSGYEKFINEFNKLFKFKQGVIDEILEKIKQLHGIRIAHNDSHLNNMMIDENGNIKFIDFGLSEYYEPESEEEKEEGIDSEDDYEILKESLKDFAKYFEKEEKKYPKDSIEHIRNKIVLYQFSYLEEYFDDLL
jgi:serine/threonine protein kinase